jgi:hypothetical protein
LLTDSDWAEINKLKRAFDEGGSKALSNALEELKKDPVRTFRIMAAFYPEKLREAVKDVPRAGPKSGAETAKPLGR